MASMVPVAVVSEAVTPRAVMAPMVTVTTSSSSPRPSRLMGRRRVRRRWPGLKVTVPVASRAVVLTAVTSGPARNSWEVAASLASSLVAWDWATVAVHGTCTVCSLLMFRVKVNTMSAPSFTILSKSAAATSAASSSLMVPVPAASPLVVVLRVTIPPPSPMAGVSPRVMMTVSLASFTGSSVTLMVMLAVVSPASMVTERGDGVR